MRAYTTERQITAQVRAVFEQRVREDEENAREAAKRGEEYKRLCTPAVFNSQEYAQWMRMRIDSARKHGLLLTDRQWADLEERVPLAGRARYVGPTRTEGTAFGPYVREHGQLGEVTVAETSDGWVATFRPDLPDEDTSETVLVNILKVHSLDGVFVPLERVE